ncbi:hypothetical protein OIU77_006632 [Salix suchowensis]|uniref:Wall-associated receptor kinase galacturonan-binding domain-containing protein n=1 Tax=Salix suchowensis TaxID=1278906 RepID=A0ABQ9ALB5_9ROSI|nr:hypothetical protein OIU77_006632 [Salix suchowensis]
MCRINFAKLVVLVLSIGLFKDKARISSGSYLFCQTGIKFGCDKLKTIKQIANLVAINALVKRKCEICGTTIIPYPLSTGPNCGDKMYYSFHCDDSIGQLSFEMPGGNYLVTGIDEELQKFSIRDEDSSKEKRGSLFLVLLGVIGASVIIPCASFLLCYLGKSKKVTGRGTQHANSSIVILLINKNIFNENPESDQLLKLPSTQKTKKAIRGMQPST